MHIDMRVTGAKEFSARLKRAGQSIEDTKKTRTERACVYLMNYIQRKKLSGNPIHRRTGMLVTGMNYNVESSGQDVIGHVGNKRVHSAIHETGGTITAKNSTFLTIPLDAAKTPAGVLRKPARQWENTFVSRSAKGNLIIFQKNAKGITPLFVLKKSVKIPARPYFRPALMESAKKIIEIIGEVVRTAVRIGNGQ